MKSTNYSSGDKKVLPSVNRVVVDESFMEEAYYQMPYDARLEKLMKILAVGTGMLNDAQVEVVGLAYARLLDNATGDILDGIASRFGIKRKGREDIAIKAEIKLHALRQTNQGTRGDIVKILKILVGEGGLLYINKTVKSNVQVIMSLDCLNLSDIDVNLQDLFPINTNVQILQYAVADLRIKPFGFNSVNDDISKSPFGVFSSVEDKGQNILNKLASVASSTELSLKGLL